MEVQVQGSFWRDLNIGPKLGFGFGVMVVIITILGLVTLYTNRLEGQAFEDFVTFEETTLLAEEMEISFLSARRFAQSFFARWSVEGIDEAFENYVVPNQSSLATFREQALDLERSFTAGDETEDVSRILSNLDEYEQLLNTIIADIQQRGHIDTGLEGQFRSAIATLEESSVITANPELYVTLLQIRRHEKDFLARFDVEDANTTIAFANELKSQIEELGLSISDTQTLTDLIDDYIASFNEFITVALRINENIGRIDAEVETIIPILEDVVADEQAEATAAQERFLTIERYTAFVDVILIVAGLVSGIGLAVLIGRDIVTEVGNLTRTAEVIASGDFEQRVTINSNDELGQLGQSFNQMVEKIVSRERDVQAIVDVAGRIATILDENRLLQDVVDLSKERFNLYHAHIYLLDDDVKTLKLTAGAGYVGRQMVAEKRTIDMSNQESIVAQTARTRESAIVNDVRTSETFLPHPLLPDTRSELAVALVARGQVLGVLDVQSNRVGYFNEDILEVMQTFATQIANALSNARLFEAVQRTNRHAQALTSIQQKMQSANDMDEMLQTTAHALAKALRVPYAAIELKLDSETTETSDATSNTTHGSTNGKANGNRPVTELHNEEPN